MKKRITSLLLILAIFFTILPASTVSAQQPYSPWAFEDLVVGDTYGIYPQTWYSKGMQKPIDEAKLRVLMAGLRHKILNTNRVIDYEEVDFKLKDKMTVKEVLEFLHSLIASYELDGNIGIVDGGKAVDYMSKYGIFTGKEGELGLNDVCTVEQACVFAIRLVTHIYDALDAASKGFLWEIKSGDNTVYLLGSIHVATYDIYPFSNKMLKAFAESDVLGVELDLVNPSNDGSMLLMEYGVYTDGTTLKDHVSEETYQLTVQVAANYGLSEEYIALFKPWAIFTMFASVTSTNSASLDEAATAAALGIDMKFTVDAYLTGKPIVELEGYDLQLRMLDSFSDELEEYLLLDTMKSIIYQKEVQEKVTNSTSAVDIMLDYWHRGDVEGFMAMMVPLQNDNIPLDLSDEDKKIMELMEEYNYKLFTERDKGMAEKIDQFLQGEGSTTYFVVVGSGHYISDYSVIDILKDKGYEINQIK